ncbi:MAG TPA: shikimate kinase [Phycisphaerae bacterium]|nr:shikimate kinase [Phycisphaerae bacterium]
MNLVLVGYRGSGKSTVGEILARRMGWRFLDLDAVIVERAGQSIAQLFATEGEAGFRRREKEACESLRKAKNHVVALGGGALEDPETRLAAKRLGKIVWLRAPAAILWSRISRDPSSPRNRPDLTPGGGLAEVETTLKLREANYGAMAAHQVDTISDSPEQVAEAIELWFRANDTEQTEA